MATFPDFNVLIARWTVDGLLSGTKEEGTALATSATIDSNGIGG